MSSELAEFRQLLDQLADTTQSVPTSLLFGLSDLAGQKLDAFRMTWVTLSTTQRQHLLQALAELAEANIQVNFDAIFRSCLDDPDGQVRASAINGLWENEGTGLIGPFLTMLRQDPSERVRTAAAAGLGRYVLAGQLDQLESPVQLRILNELLTTFYLKGESIEVRRRAVESVSYACTPEVHQALETAYYEDDEKMQLSAVLGMGRSCDERWQSIVLSELESHSPAMRYEAAVASGELALRPAVPALANLLDDSHRLVRDATIWALGQIGGTQAKELLLAAYEEADEDAQAAIDDALAEQELLEGDMEFALYALEEEGEQLYNEDDFIPLWSTGDSNPLPPDSDLS
jgi:HEAT repeat protein